MNAINLLFAVLTVTTLVRAIDPTTIQLNDMCTSPRKFDLLDETSSIYVINTNEIKCDINLETNHSESKFAIAFVIFKYNCTSMTNLEDIIACSGIQAVAGQIFQATPENSSYVYKLPKTDKNGSLKILITLTTPYTKDLGCAGGKADDLFTCADNTCIFKGFKCNGVKNCVDGSDEADSVCKAKPSESGGLGWGWVLIIIIAVAGVIGVGVYYGYKRMQES